MILALIDSIGDWGNNATTLGLVLPAWEVIDYPVIKIVRDCYVCKLTGKTMVPDSISVVTSYCLLISVQNGRSISALWM